MGWGKGVKRGDYFDFASIRDIDDVPTYHTYHLIMKPKSVILFLTWFKRCLTILHQGPKPKRPIGLASGEASSCKANHDNASCRSEGR